MTPHQGSWFAFLLIGLSILVGGCRKKSEKETGDSKVLEALAPYNPRPTLDEQGRVVELKLEGPQVDDKALGHVKNLAELKTLSLYGSSVTDGGLANLNEARRLEALGLGKTAVSRNGLTHLERLPALRWLWVTENKTLTPAQIEDFKKRAVPGVTVYP